MTTAAGLGRVFDAWAAAYDRYRPGYPDALFDEIALRLSLPERPDVVDVGAGTGRATLAMAARGWPVTAVEPGTAMLEILRARAAEDGLVIATIHASAEKTGIDPDTVDLVTAAQAFHWFDGPRALEEAARILRPGGGLALFWNVRDEERSSFVAGYHDLLQRRFGEADTGRYIQAGRPTGAERTRKVLTESHAFTDVQLTEVRHEVPMTAASFLGMAFTASYVRDLDTDEQERFRRDLTTLLDRHTPSGEPFVVPYRIDLWTARRRAS
jgi:SAM-dependent methyltransferase